MPVARHLSIAWGVTLAVLAVLEWNSLEREPLREPLLSPFIERSISLAPAAVNGPADPSPRVAATDRGGIALQRATVSHLLFWPGNPV